MKASLRHQQWKKASSHCDSVRFSRASRSTEEKWLLTTCLSACFGSIRSISTPSLRSRATARSARSWELETLKVGGGDLASARRKGFPSLSLPNMRLWGGTSRYRPRMVLTEPRRAMNRQRCSGNRNRSARANSSAASSCPRASSSTACRSSGKRQTWTSSSASWYLAGGWSQLSDVFFTVVPFAPARIVKIMDRSQIRGHFRVAQGSDPLPASRLLRVTSCSAKGLA